MSKVKKIIPITQTRYDTLYNGGAKDGTITVNGTSYGYDSEALYLVQETEPTYGIINSTTTGDNKIYLTKNGVAIDGSSVTVGFAQTTARSDTATSATNADNSMTVGGYTPGNLSGNVPLSNGTLNTNLNADLLDGNHGSYYLTASNLTGTLSADRLATSGVTAGSYGQTSSGAPGYGGTMLIPYITVDAKGRITSATSRTVTLPPSVDTHWSHTLSLAGVSKTLTNGTTTYTADELLEGLGLSGGLDFVGVVTAVPTSSKQGQMYKIGASGLSLTASNNSEGSSVSLKVGDTLICKTTSTTAPVFYYIPSGDDIEDTDTWRAVQVNSSALLGTGLSTGALNFAAGSKMAVSGSSGTVTYSHVAISAPSAGSSTAATYLNGLTFDGYGHVTGYTQGTLANMASNIANSLYWADVKASTSSSTATSPTFSAVTAPTVNGYHLALSGVTSATMDTTSTNPSIIFSESGSQQVALIYTDWDNYRYPAGLKIMGRSSGASPAWLEVEGHVYGSEFIGSGTSLTNLNASYISSGTLAVARLAASGVGAGSYGPSGNASPAHGGSFSVPSITTDAYGRITAASTRSVSLPETIGEAYLTWGGKDFVEGFAPIDAAMVGTLGANRLAFIPASIITAEYSRDSGSTWTDYGASDDVKTRMFVGELGTSMVVGKPSASGETTSDYQLRITIGGGSAVYTTLNKFVIYCSTSGAGGCTVDIFGAANRSETTFTLLKTASLGGWSGYNVINTGDITFNSGGNLTQYKYLRFVFKCASGSTTYGGLSIYNIQGFGGVGWTTPSTFARTRQLYSMSSDQSATFPRNLTAQAFYGSGVGLTGTASGLSIGGNAATATTSSSCSGNSSTSSTASKVASSLSWSGYSVGSYNGSSAISFAIPNNTNQLTNGAGFITGITAAMVNAVGSITNNTSGSSASCTGNAATATALSASRSFLTNLASTSSASFNGTANATLGVTGVLPVANGGTGNTTNNAATLGGLSLSSSATASTIVARDANNYIYSTYYYSAISNEDTMTPASVYCSQDNWIRKCSTAYFISKLGLLTSHQAVVNNNPTLSWGATSTVGSVGGTALQVTMPTNPNTDTHWTTGIFAGASGTATNSATASPYIKVTDSSTYRGQIRLIGSGATTVNSDGSGNVTIATNASITKTSATSFSITIGSHTITFTSNGDGDSTSDMTVTCS